MKLEMNYVNTDRSDSLSAFIQSKADKLDTFYDGIIGGEVYIRNENGAVNKDKIVEMRLNVPGTTLFAKEADDSYESAAEKTVEALRRQINKFKDKQGSH